FIILPIAKAYGKIERIFGAHVRYRYSLGAAVSETRLKIKSWRRYGDPRLGIQMAGKTKK
ncbi:hypothetical protein, partial [uncultured Chryseobacterium sp.]|uniref:hypothetical protein n=1 Tax=uncultured Chryseobacterium sp. TaxID=259322 RepID=UPI0025D83BF5